MKFCAGEVLEFLVVDFGGGLGGWVARAGLLSQDFGLLHLFHRSVSEANF